MAETKLRSTRCNHRLIVADDQGIEKLSKTLSAVFPDWRHAPFFGKETVNGDLAVEVKSNGRMPFDGIAIDDAAEATKRLLEPCLPREDFKSARTALEAASAAWLAKNTEMADMRVRFDVVSVAILSENTGLVRHWINVINLQEAFERNGAKGLLCSPFFFLDRAALDENGGYGRLGEMQTEERRPQPRHGGVSPFPAWRQAGGRSRPSEGCRGKEGDRKMPAKKKGWDERLRFSDDAMFRRVMRDEEIARGVIEAALGIKVGRIDYLNTEQEMAPGPRALERGAGLATLKHSYVVFICSQDPMGAGMPRYTFEPRCLESPEIELEAKQSWIALNAASWRDAEDPALRQLLQYVYTGAVDDSEASPLAEMIDDAVAFANGDEKWRRGVLSEKDYLMTVEVAAFNRGEARGEARGKAKLSELARLLSEAGRGDEFFAALSDDRKMAELMEEFGIE